MPNKEYQGEAPLAARRAFEVWRPKDYKKVSVVYALTEMKTIKNFQWFVLIVLNLFFASLKSVFFHISC